jgi:hypothetical protein
VTFLAGEDITSQRLDEEIGIGLRKNSDQSVTSSTTLVNDTQLTWPVSANTNYVFSMDLVYTGAATGNLKVGWGTPSGATMSWSAVGLDTSLGYKNVANLAAGTTSNFGAVSTTIGRLVQLTGYLHVDVTAGTFVLKWAQDTSNASSTVMRAGSAGIVYRM